MKFRLLPWDSNFFDYRVAGLDVDADCSRTQVQSILQQEKFDVCYVYVQQEPQGLSELLLSSGAVLYDQKVTYKKNITAKAADATDSIVEELKENSPEISALAAASGGNSRFFLDIKFRPKQAALYEKWINNCFENPLGRVFGIFQSGVLAALAGTTIDEKTGHLELLAVKPDFRRRGYAGKLIAATENFYLNNKINYAEIVTQKGNVAACRTYESCGYTLKDTVDVWHFWKE